MAARASVAVFGIFQGERESVQIVRGAARARGKKRTRSRD